MQDFRILIIDDNEAIHTDFQKVLESRLEQGSSEGSGCLL